jgi:anti-sigma regulatory factor (Ser/Thr protein kinase)
VADTLRSWHVPNDVADDAVLLVSELVTNALLHARSAPVVELEHDDVLLRCVVVDHSSVVPRRRRYATDAVTGRGIALVETLASRWGVDVDSGSGKRVWFELAIDNARGGRGVRA